MKGPHSGVDGRPHSGVDERPPHSGRGKARLAIWAFPAQHSGGGPFGLPSTAEWRGAGKINSSRSDIHPCLGLSAIDSNTEYIYNIYTRYKDNIHITIYKIQYTHYTQ